LFPFSSGISVQYNSLFNRAGSISFGIQEIVKFKRIIIFLCALGQAEEDEVMTLQTDYVTSHKGFHAPQLGVSAGALVTNCSTLCGSGPLLCSA